MRSAWSMVLAPGCITAGIFWALVAWNPFHVTQDLAGQIGGAVRRDAMSTNIYRNASTQEVTLGAAPMAGLNELAADWCRTSTAQHFVVMGNSQTHTILLAPSEPATTGVAERTYVDQIQDLESTRGAAVRGYRLSAPNLSYPEALWYLNYFLSKPCLLPQRLIVQMNFESLRKQGVRSGMLELLGDPAFHSQIELESHSDAAYAAAFQQAIDRYGELTSRAHSAATGSVATGKTGISQSVSVGNRIESEFRRSLDESATFRSRGELKSEFLQTLYLLRVHVLHIKPTTKRSIGGAALAMNVSALERIGKLCAEHNIKLEFFIAPQNPSASLYATPADRAEFHAISERLARTYAWRWADLENSIPQPMWGVWIDGPDPIHFGRAGHARMAELLIADGLIPDGS